ncbi:mucin-2-like isoform X2 [Neocloeon triangulifer]|uniref:mucin-2-like isoform X2 n=1 Tax=Neocloeon triangulifer TaxID=2078957 RepID=UPI00286F4B97|nr:mucin-2-like isoform X2 [Neocloeon triangulifer]
MWTITLLHIVVILISCNHFTSVSSALIVKTRPSLYTIDTLNVKFAVKRKRNVTRVRIQKCCGPYTKKCNPTKKFTTKTSTYNTILASKITTLTNEASTQAVEIQTNLPNQDSTTLVEESTLSEQSIASSPEAETTTTELSTLSDPSTEQILLVTTEIPSSTTSAAITTMTDTTTTTITPTSTVAQTTTTVAQTTTNVAQTTTTVAKTTTTVAQTTTTVAQTTTTIAKTTTTVAQTTSTVAQTSTTTTKPTTTTTKTSTSTSTTTTTPKPLCLPYSCNTNSSKLGSDGRVLASAVTDGVLKEIGNRQYLFSSSAKSWPEAASACCSLGMSLLSLETADEYLSIADIVDSSDNGSFNGEYFTSGSDNKLENSFVWCTSNNTTIASPPWAAGEPSDKTETENCIVVYTEFGKNPQLGDKSCPTATKYICEMPVIPRVSTCVQQTCKADPNLIGSDGQVNMTAPAIDGNFMVICGKLYFISKSAKTWQESADECCKRKMRYLTVETDEEHMCLAEFMMNPYGRQYNGVWFWTSGSDISVEGVYTWCYSDNTQANISFSNVLKWAVTQPDNGGNVEDCINIFTHNVAPPGSIDYNDIVCSRGLQYICERPLFGSVPFPECPTVDCKPEFRKLETRR